MSESMSGAEMRSRMSYLGLTTTSLTKLTGWDERTIRRQAAGIRPVTERVEVLIYQLEERAKNDFTRFTEAAAEGTPITIPRLDTPQNAGEVPPHWWLALAARAIAAFGDQIMIEWE